MGLGAGFDFFLAAVARSAEAKTSNRTLKANTTRRHMKSSVEQIKAGLVLNARSGHGRGKIMAARLTFGGNLAKDAPTLVAKQLPEQHALPQGTRLLRKHLIKDRFSNGLRSGSVRRGNKE
jgi:MarR-like DNA-binding transcriptional regulator SgrR of sgrS sRNA